MTLRRVREWLQAELRQSLELSSLNAHPFTIVRHLSTRVTRTLHSYPPNAKEIICPLRFMLNSTPPPATHGDTAEGHPQAG